MYKNFSNPLFLGKEVIYLPSCHSTNDLATDLLARNRPEGALVITDHQTAGRGQRGHTWTADPGQNLTFSVLFRPTFVQANAPFVLHLFVSLALYRWAKQWGIAQPAIKWPNDLYAGTHKLGGILIENTLKQGTVAGSVVGIGLNINQTEFGDLRATSLARETGQTYALREVLESLLLHLEQQYLQLKKGKTSQLWQDYHHCLLGFQKPRTYRTATGHTFTGMLEEVQPSGMARIRDAQGEVHGYQHGEISWVFD